MPLEFGATQREADGHRARGTRIGDVGKLAADRTPGALGHGTPEDGAVDGVQLLLRGALVGAMIGNLLLPVVMMAREGSSFKMSSSGVFVFDCTLASAQKSGE